MNSRRNVVDFSPRVSQRLAGPETQTPRKLKFTESALATLPLSAQRYDVADKAIVGLICRVGARDRTLYVRRKMRGSGKLVYHRLGIVGERPLGEYRALAERVAAELSAGKVPGTDLPRRGVLTLGRAFGEYMEARRLRPGTVRAYRQDFETWEGWASRPITSITPAEVLARHRQRSRESPARADGALRVLRAVSRYAERVHGIDLLNPIDHVAAADAWNRVDRRRSLIPADLVPAWTKAVMTLPDDHGKARSGTARDALLLIMVTGLRLREALHLRWDELDLARGRFTLGAGRMKGNAVHELPIPRRALARLRARRDGGELYVFPGVAGKPLDRIPQRYLDGIGREIGHPFVPHDLRRTVATWLGANAPGYVVKRVLSHADPSRAADATAGYINIDPEALRPWLQAWEDVLYGEDLPT